MNEYPVLTLLHTYLATKPGALLQTEPYGACCCMFLSLSGEYLTTGLVMGAAHPISPSCQQRKQRAALLILRTGFCSLVLAVSEKLKDVHFDLGLAQPLRSAVDAILGQGDGEPLPSAALHGVIQDSSCGQATTRTQLVPSPVTLLFSSLPPLPPSSARQLPASPSPLPSLELFPKQVLYTLRGLGL